MNVVRRGNPFNVSFSGLNNFIKETLGTGFLNLPLDSAILHDPKQ